MVLAHNSLFKLKDAGDHNKFKKKYLLLYLQMEIKLILLLVIVSISTN